MQLDVLMEKSLQIRVALKGRYNYSPVFLLTGKNQLVTLSLSGKLRKGGMDILKTIDGNIKRGMLAIIQRIPFDRVATYIVAKRTIGGYLRLMQSDLFPFNARGTF